MIRDLVIIGRLHIGKTSSKVAYRLKRVLAIMEDTMHSSKAKIIMHGDLATTGRYHLYN